MFFIKVKPLRDRKNDIEPLANHFLKIALKDMKRPAKQLSDYHLQQIQAYDWPVNVRKLHNVIERAAILTISGSLELDLPGGKPISAQGKETCQQSLLTRDQELEVFTEQQMLQFQKENIEAALISCGWKIYGNDGAAALLGIKPTTLATMIQKLQLRAPNRKNIV